LAPMEGLTSYIFRNAYSKYYGGIDAYYTPFISLHHNKAFNSKELRELAPENNSGIHLIPQVLTNSAADFLEAEPIFLEMGYDHINLNFGCPSATVTSKNKGSGILRDPEHMDRFLDEIFRKSSLKISVKTRLGFDRSEEWEPIFRIYAQYPLEALIVHPRLRNDFYDGIPDLMTFSCIYETARSPLFYNGDIFTVEKLKDLEATYPQLSGIMLGRGLLAFPDLLSAAKGHPVDLPREQAFHDEILSCYIARDMGDEPVLRRMKEWWFYLSWALEIPPKLEKQLKKARTCREFKVVTDQIFRSAIPREIRR